MMIQVELFEWAFIAIIFVLMLCVLYCLRHW